MQVWGCPGSLLTGIVNLNKLALMDLGSRDQQRFKMPRRQVENPFYTDVYVGGCTAVILTYDDLFCHTPAFIRFLYMHVFINHFDLLACLNKLQKKTNR